VHDSLHFASGPAVLFPAARANLRAPSHGFGSAVEKKCRFESRQECTIAPPIPLIFVVVEIGDVDGFRRLVPDVLHNADVSVPAHSPPAHPPGRDTYFHQRRRW